MIRDARNGAEMYVIGGQGQEGTVMKMVLGTGQWFSLPGMYYPRRQHACTRVSFFLSMVSSKYIFHLVNLHMKG